MTKILASILVLLKMNEKPNAPFDFTKKANRTHSSFVDYHDVFYSFAKHFQSSVCIFAATMNANYRKKMDKYWFLVESETIKSLKDVNGEIVRDQVFREYFMGVTVNR